MSQDIDNERQQHHNVSNLKQQTGMRTRSGRVIKRSGFQDTVEIAECRVSPRKISKVEGVTKDQKKVPIFSKKGCLSPRTTVRTVAKSKQKLNEITLCPANTTLVTDSTTKNSAFHDENSLRTPTKQVIKICEAPKPVELKSLVKKELNYDEIKTKISKSAKLQELKASLARIQEIEKTRKIQEEKARSVPAKKITIAQLKEFDTAQLEVFSR